MANRLHPRVKRTRENVQQCKDCKGNGSMPDPARPPRLMGCPTCNGQGFILHRAPYRLADGTWSDGVDRTSMIKLHKFHIENPSRPIVIQTWDQRPDGGYDWVAIESKYGEPEYFRTQAEAIRYADHHARTTKNGDAP